jgi:hypothetical protein
MILLLNRCLVPIFPEKEKVASVSFMITNSQKALLREKGYSEKEIGAMKPAEAH